MSRLRIFSLIWKLVIAINEMLLPHHIHLFWPRRVFDLSSMTLVDHEVIAFWCTSIVLPNVGTRGLMGQRSMVMLMRLVFSHAAGNRASRVKFGLYGLIR